MTCFHPLTAFQQEDGLVVFRETASARRSLELPCGQCRGCRLERSRQWAIRCMHEASLHEENCFVTLTYKNNPRSLDYRDFQLFMKRLRKKRAMFDVHSWQHVPRFYACGEYGDEGDRPHFHACLFGYRPVDGVLHSQTAAGSRIYSSKSLEDFWSLGFASFGDVTFESAAYVARYVMKKISGPPAADHYERFDVESGEVYSLTPEFCRMSLKPGVGSMWIQKWLSDVYPHDRVVVNGRLSKPPRFYDQFCKDPIRLEFDRWEKSKLAHLEDSSPDRLLVREQVLKARLSFKKRSL